MPNPLTVWNPVVTRGLTFLRNIALTQPDGTPVTQFAGSEWVLYFYQPSGDLIYQTVSGDWADINAYTKQVTLDPSVTDLFPPNNFTYDLDVIGSQTWRLISNGRGVAQENA